MSDRTLVASRPRRSYPLYGWLGLGLVLVFWLLLYWMYRRKLFLRI